MRACENLGAWIVCGLVILSVIAVCAFGEKHCLAITIVSLVFLFRHFGAASPSLVGFLPDDFLRLRIRTINIIFLLRAFAGRPITRSVFR